MKRHGAMIRLTTFLVCLSFYASAQWIARPSIVPQWFPGVEPAYLVIQTTTPHLGGKLKRSVTIENSGAVTIDICNYSGMFMALQNHLDTFDLGVLPMGMYQVTVNYTISNEAHECSAYISETLSSNFRVGGAMWGETDGAGMLRRKQ